MRLDSINAFIQAAGDVLKIELGTEVRRGQMSLLKVGGATNEITTFISFTGAFTGIVLYAMSAETALAIASSIRGQEFPELDELAQSGIAELGNVITGRAMMILAQQGFACTIAPPVMVRSTDSVVFSTFNLPRLAILLHTDKGTIDLQLAFKERG